MKENTIENMEEEKIENNPVLDQGSVPNKNSQSQIAGAIVIAGLIIGGQ